MRNLTRFICWLCSAGMLALTCLILQIIFWYGIPNDWDHLGQDPLRIDRSEWFWQGHTTYKPNLGIVPPVPSAAMVKLSELGDAQWLFRTYALQLQHAGDSFARVTPLKDYDYQALYDWWKILDGLDPQSHYNASLVAYYYSSSQNVMEHLPFVVRYLEEHSDLNPEKKWWWYAQAAYHANHRLKDKNWALRIAEKLYNLPRDVKMPLWARQMKIFFLEQEGEYVEACQMILNILDTHEDLSEGEINFIMIFIHDRVRAMMEVGDPKLLENIDPRCNPLIEMKREQMLSKHEGIGR